MKSFIKRNQSELRIIAWIAFIPLIAGLSAVGIFIIEKAPKFGAGVLMVLTLALMIGFIRLWLFGQKEMYRGFKAKGAAFLKEEAVLWHILTCFVAYAALWCLVYAESSIINYLYGTNWFDKKSERMILALIPGVYAGAGMLYCLYHLFHKLLIKPVFRIMKREKNAKIKKCSERTITPCVFFYERTIIAERGETMENREFEEVFKENESYIIYEKMAEMLEDILSYKRRIKRFEWSVLHEEYRLSVYVDRCEMECYIQDEEGEIVARIYCGERLEVGLETKLKIQGEYQKVKLMETELIQQIKGYALELFKQFQYPTGVLSEDETYRLLKEEAERVRLRKQLRAR